MRRRGRKVLGYTRGRARSWPHDRAAFTQGLIFRDGFLYESTGLNGRSSLRKVNLETGEVVQRESVASEYFAEGLTDWKDRLIQIQRSFDSISNSISEAEKTLSSAIKTLGETG